MPSAGAMTDGAVMPTLAHTEPLRRLAEDVGLAARLLAGDDPVRGYLELLATLPADPAAWSQVLDPWVDDARHGAGPPLTDRRQIGALGALGVAVLRAARELGDQPALAAALRAISRWCFFRVRTDAA
jgi:hypothetical protein